MNILDIVAGILGAGCIKGFLPDKPDKLIALFEYPGITEAYFDQTGESFNVQARCRAKASAEAYSMALSVKDSLDRYTGQGVAIRQTTPVLDIGRDDANPPRHEYTVNFKINMTGG